MERGWYKLLVMVIWDIVVALYAVSCMACTLDWKLIFYYHAMYHKCRYIIIVCWSIIITWKAIAKLLFAFNFSGNWLFLIYIFEPWRGTAIRYHKPYSIPLFIAVYKRMFTYKSYYTQNEYQEKWNVS